MEAEINSTLPNTTVEGEFVLGYLVPLPLFPWLGIKHDWIHLGVALVKTKLNGKNDVVIVKEKAKNIF